MFDKKLSFGFYKRGTFYYFKAERSTYKNHLFKIEFDNLELDYLFYFLYCYILSEANTISDILYKRVKDYHFLRLNEIRHIANFLKLSRFNIEFLYDIEIKDLLYLLNRFNFDINTFFEYDNQFQYFVADNSLQNLRLFDKLSSIKNELIFKLNNIPYSVIGLDKDIPLGISTFNEETNKK